MLSMIIGGLAVGFIFAPLALGVHISYRMLRFTDMSVDGTFALGAVVAARLIMNDVNPLTATLLAAIAGAIAGAGTGTLITRFGIQRILAGILIMSALYTVNTFILGGSTFESAGHATLQSYAESAATAVFGDLDVRLFLGMKVSPRSVFTLIFSGVISLIAAGVLLMFFRTRIGLAVRGAGSNEAAMRAMGADVPWLLIIALAISNGLAALAGAMFIQELPSFTVADGVGMIVTGLACVMIGDAFFGRKTFSTRFIGALVGALFYRTLIAVVFYLNILSVDIRLATAVFVTLALVTPRLLKKLRTPRNTAPQPE